MPSPVWRGSASLVEASDSPEFENTQDGPRYTRHFSGPYASVMSSLPDRRAAMSGTPSGFLVDTVKVDKAPGRRGTMTVTLTPNPIEDAFQSGEPVGLLEIEWIEIQKRLELHPRYQTGGDSELSSSDLDAIEEWKNQNTASDRAVKYAKLTDNAQEFVDKLQRGQDSFIVYAPVARQTTRTKDQPDSTNCGFISAPPDPIAIDGYTYLKTADRINRRGDFFEHILEWTGGTDVDTDIYSDDPGT